MERLKSRDVSRQIFNDPSTKCMTRLVKILQSMPGTLRDGGSCTGELWNVSLNIETALTQSSLSVDECNNVTNETFFTDGGRRPREIWRTNFHMAVAWMKIDDWWRIIIDDMMNSCFQLWPNDCVHCVLTKAHFPSSILLCLSTKWRFEIPQQSFISPFVCSVSHGAAS